MSDELIEIPKSENLMIQRDPNAVLEEAKKAAQALMTVVKQKQKPVIFNNEQYIEFEDWQTVGRFYGLTAKVESTTYIEYGSVRGFESAASVLNSRGEVISRAEAMCLNDEDKWSTRAKYNSKREKIGEVAVPLFQLRSMAQTRACAKAFRNVLAWVVVLAGFKPTVAEEMTGDEEPGTPAKPPIPMPQPKTNGDFKIMPAKFSSECKLCHGAIKEGETIAYSKTAGTFHKACHEAPKPADSQPLPVSEKEIDTLKRLAATVGIDEKKLIDALGAEGCESFEMLGRDLYSRMMKSIAKKIDEKASGQ